MTYTVDKTTAFLKDVALAKRRGLDLERLWTAVGILTLGQRMPPQYHDHALLGKWRGKRECHIAPDWVLVYERTTEKLVLLLVRTGTHRELGLGG